MMMEDTLPLFASWLVDQVQSSHGHFYGRSLIAAHEVRDLVQSNFSISPRIRDAYAPKLVGVALRSIGWNPYPQQIRLVAGEKLRLWCSTPQLLNNSAVFLRAKLLKEMKVPVEFVMEAGE